MAMVELLLDYGASVAHFGSTAQRTAVEIAIRAEILKLAQFIICDQRRYHFWAMRKPMARLMMACIRQLKARGAVEVGASDKLEWFEQKFGRSKRFFEDRATGYELCNVCISNTHIPLSQLRFNLGLAAAINGVSAGRSM
jgi:hypothetical protein